MRGSLLNPIGERRRARRTGAGHRSAQAAKPKILARRTKVATSPPAIPVSLSEVAAAPAEISATPAEVPAPSSGVAARRVRDASGLTDRASYACACGYLFAATVSTTVQCPHCGAAQAW
jgi:hypothetical protein